MATAPEYGNMQMPVHQGGSLDHLLVQYRLQQHYYLHKIQRHDENH
jgi:hypothetical protein